MSGRVLALASAFVLAIVPLNAQAYSVADLAGCYVAQLDGQVLADPTTGQWVPEKGLVSFCANGAGGVTRAWGYSKMGGCGLITYSNGGGSTYSVNSSGGGVVTANVQVVAVKDLCQGAVPIPVTSGEKAVMRFLFYLDAEGAVHILGLDTTFPNNPVMPFLPEATSGMAWKQ